MGIRFGTTGTAAMLAVVLSAVCASAQEAGPKGVYGEDDRQDYYQASEARRKLADSTVALFKADKVSEDGGLSLKNFGETAQLCASEPFRKQPMGAFCSGSLVGPDLVMTAGHCVTNYQDCGETKMVFGFSVKKQGQYPDRVDPSEVYSCKEIVVRTQENSGPDYALIRLNRPVVNHEPLQINRTGKIAEGTRLFVIGHPVGIPVKIAGGAVVRQVAYDDYFVANLDTYGGNSGSAVFNEETGLIEGILVRGGNDFIIRHRFLFFGKCRISQKVDDSGGRGEDVTSVSVLSKYIPLPGGEVPAVNVPVEPGGSVTGGCVDPGSGASIEQLTAYLRCLTSSLQQQTSSAQN